MMSYIDTIKFLISQSNILSDSAIDNMVILTAHIYNIDIAEAYKDIDIEE